MQKSHIRIISQLGGAGKGITIMLSRFKCCHVLHLSFACLYANIRLAINARSGLDVFTFSKLLGD